MINGDPITTCRERRMVSADGNTIGDVTSAVWSPDLAVNIAIGMVEATHWGTGAHVEVSMPEGQRRATVRQLPFIQGKITKTIVSRQYFEGGGKGRCQDVFGDPEAVMACGATGLHAGPRIRTFTAM